MRVIGPGHASLRKNLAEISDSAVSPDLPFERLHGFKGFGCRAAKAARDGLIGEAVNIFERQRAFGDVGPDFLKDMVMIDQRLRNPFRD
jgi:hypothetical protein